MTTVVSSGRGIYADNQMRGAVLYAKLIGALVAGEPMSYANLADYTGLCEHTVRRYVLALREAKPKRLAYIAGWDEDVRGNPSIRLFLFGSKKDVPRPKQTNAERLRRAKKRKVQLGLIQATAGKVPHEQRLP